MKRTVSISAVIGLVMAALGLLVAPDPHRLGEQREGDAALAARVEAALDGDVEGYRGLSVAFVDDGRTATALLGDPAGGPRFEAGSVVKTMTGMLLADLVADGVVRPDDTLGETLPSVRFTDPDTASITLEELASQRSGLPRLAPGALQFLRGVLANLRNGNPYAGQDVGALLDSAADAEPGDTRGQVGYSNFGIALLGHALAAKTGTPYPQLVTERLLRPLGMADTLITVPDPAPAGLAEGSTAAGNRADPWRGAGYAPAGIDARTTAPDMGKLVAATIAGTAPGADAATPRFTEEDGDGRIGYAWFTDRYGDREITWHNGATGGFTSYLGFDRASGQGVVVLGNTDRPVEWIGLRLLGADPPAGLRDDSAGPLLVVVTALLLGWAAAAIPVLMFGRRIAGRRWPSTPDRLRAVGTVLSTVALLVFVHRIGTWLSVPPVLWTVAAGFAAAGTTALALSWRRLPLVADGKPASRIGELVVSAAISVAVLAFLL